MERLLWLTLAMAITLRAAAGLLRFGLLGRGEAALGRDGRVTMR